MQRFTGKNVRIVRPRRNFSKEVASKAYVKRQVTKHEDYINAAPSLSATNAAYDSHVTHKFTPADEITYFKSAIRFRGQLKNPNTAGCTARVIIFQYLESDENAPVATDFMSGNVNTAASSFITVNTSSKRRAKLLYDKSFYLGGSTGNDAPKSKQLNIVIPLRRLSRKTMSQTGSSSAVKGNIYLFAWSDIANASSPPTIAGYLGARTVLVNRS